MTIEDFTLPLDNLQLDQASPEQLSQWQQQLEAEYRDFQAQGLNLDLTRGKPSAEQLSLSNALDGLLHGEYRAADGTDSRNYGGLDGLPEAKQFGAAMLDVAAENILVGGNASLSLMFQAVHFAYQFGLAGPGSAWKDEGAVKFLCPVPGYDRHFAVCEQFGIEMIPVPMTDAGPDMDEVESLVKNNPLIKGIWCVPKYSNPTGIVYSDETVDRIAQLGAIAGAHFRVFWDNAYCVHDLVDNPPQLANIMERARAHGTEDSILQFASTSKITFAGSGISFLNASAANLARFKQLLGIFTIGPDKVNQLRHVRFLKDRAGLLAHMKQHASILKPRFDLVLKYLEEGLTGFGAWTAPQGGYFISFDTRPGLAGDVVKLAAEAGVKLTPAGATFPHGNDPEDKNIRLAPSFPSLDEIDRAMAVFVCCVRLATVRQALNG